MLLLLVAGVFNTIRANPTNAMRLYDISSQHIVSSRLGSVSALKEENSKIQK